MAQTFAPSPVDQVNVSIIMDNNVDLLMEGSDVVRRFPLEPNCFDNLFPVAEHGFSALIEVKNGDKDAQILFDAGISRKGILHNLDALEINLGGLQAIVLSHGHADHALGLVGILERLGRRSMPLVLHPDAFSERELVLPTGDEIQIPAPRIADFGRENIEVVEEVGPSMLVDDLVLISGEAARTTSFEKGFPIHYSKRNAHWENDPLIMDDQCAIINVEGKGLVVLTGCGHSGIINIIRNAQVVTGVQEIHAVIGGFHLTGGLFDPIIPETIAALQVIGPRYVMPGHCTGWSALHQIAAAMLSAFIAGSIGTTLML